MDSTVTPIEKAVNCLENQRNFVLQGGAGSGKTETLKQLIEYISETYPTKKIACITHTNLAANEIESRVGKSFTVGTIHSFLNSLIKGYKKNLKTVIYDIFTLEKMQSLDISNYNSEKEQNKKEHERFKKLHGKYSDKLYTIFGESSAKCVNKRSYDQNPEGFNNELNLSIDNLNKMIQCEIEKKKYNIIHYNETSFDNLAELSYGHDSLIKLFVLLFNKYPMLRKVIQDKYDYIFIDEYQDTNEGIIDSFLRAFSHYDSTVIGMFGDSMQAIYGEGIGEVGNYIEEGLLVKIEKEDNYRCSEQVINFINQLRNDGLKQHVALKKNNKGEVEGLSERQGKVKLYYSIYEKKPNAHSKLDEKEDYEQALSNLINNCINDYPDNKVLMLTNKSISNAVGFENLYKLFSNRYSEPQDQIEQHLSLLQLLNLAELCVCCKNGDYKVLFNKLNKVGFQLNKLQDKVWIKESLESFYNTNKSALSTLNKAFEMGILKKSEKYTEYLARKERFLSELKNHETYNEFNQLYYNGYNTFSKMKKIKEELEEEEFKELCNKTKKEEFFKSLFSEDISFQEIMSYFRYINEESDYITMHKTKGSGIDNVLVVMDEYFWSKYNFKSIFMGDETSEERRLNNLKLFYVACSRTKKNLTCVKLISQDEEEVLKQYFQEAEKIELHDLQYS